VARGPNAGSSSLEGARRLLRRSFSNPADGEEGAPGQREREILTSLIKGVVVQVREIILLIIILKKHLV